MGFIYDASDILINKLESWGKSIIAMFPNFLLAIIVLTGFYFLARFIMRISLNLLQRAYKHREFTNIFSKIIYFVVLIIGVMTALSILDLDRTVTSLLAGAGIVGLALAFAFQDLAANLVSGFGMALKGPFQIGDIIEANGITGRVSIINLRTTMIETFDGNHVIIPNKEIYQNNITNYQQIRIRRVDITVGVSYGDDLKKAKEVSLNAVKDIKHIIKNKETTLVYKEFGDSSINFDIRYWVEFKDQIQFLEARSEGIMKIKAAFDKEGITIPFPIRTLDFGIVGGEKLNEVLDEQKIKKAS